MARFESDVMNECDKERSWEPLLNAYNVFREGYEDLLQWDEESRKKWLKNVKRGLISPDNDYPREDSEKIWGLFNEWNEMYCKKA